jgi:hypothetical protein
LEREEGEESVQFTVPVYPPLGVTVTVEVPELPSDTVMFSGLTLKEPVLLEEVVAIVIIAEPVELA